MTGLVHRSFGRHNLLINADPGARCGFVAAWLTNRLTRLAFDSGIALRPLFYKIHRVGAVTDTVSCTVTPNFISNFTGIKIRIRPSISSIDLHLLLLLKKTKELTYFAQHEYSLETFTTLTHFSQGILKWDKELDYSLYDIVIDFADTFDNDFMIALYKKVIGIDPTVEMIDTLIKTNELNSIPIDQNHACSILKLCLTHELKFQSVVDVYKNTPVDQLYDTVLKLIVPVNQGILL